MKAAFRRLMRPLLELQLKRLIARHHLKVVGVAGSVGKTTTKSAIATVLGEKYNVRVQSGNYNDTISVPLAAFNLEVPVIIMNPFAWAWKLILMERTIWSRPTVDVLVLELGTDKIGEIPHFMSYLTPDIGVLTAIAPEHMEFFKTMEAVGEEEFSIARGSKVAVLNDHFDRIHPLAKGLRPEPVWYSIAQLKPYLEGLATNYQWDQSRWPEHIQQALAASVVVAGLLKLNYTQITAGIARFNGVPGRMQQLKGLSGSVIIDDTYNAAPDSTLVALNYLRQLRVTGRRLVIMGTMNELGDQSPKYHREVGPAFADLDYLITIGKLATDELGAAAVTAGLDPTRFKPADSPVAAGEFIKLILRPGDVVLVKGSQNGVFAEEAVKLLLANPSDAGKLVRQSPAWMAKKRAQFPDIAS